MRILIGTAHRKTSADQKSGSLIVFDVGMGAAIQYGSFIEPPYRRENPNPRGGLRGIKGISIFDGKIAISNTSTIFVFDPSWKLLSYHFHPSLSLHHDIVHQENGFWVTSASNDVLGFLTYQNKIERLYDIRTVKEIFAGIGGLPPKLSSIEGFRNGAKDYRDPRTHDEIKCDSTHLNSVSIDKNGSLIVSCGLVKDSQHIRLLAIKNKLHQMNLWSIVSGVNKLVALFSKRDSKHNDRELVIQPKKGKSVLFKVDGDEKVTPILSVDDATVPSHSVKILRDGSAIYLVTTFGRLLRFDPLNGHIHNEYNIGKNFLRGALELPDGTLILGDGNFIVHFDLKKGVELWRYQILEDPDETVYDLVELPDHFIDPPVSFDQLDKEIDQIIYQNLIPKQ